MKTKLIVLTLIGIFLATGGVTTYYLRKTNIQEKSTPSATPTERLEVSLSSASTDRVVGFAMDVLWALDAYYVSTQTSFGKADSITEIMTQLFNDNSYLKEGNTTVEKYLNDDNEVIKLTAEGMIVGSKIVVEANNELVNFLRNIDRYNSGQIGELEYAIAKHNSAQKEGYKLIVISAPQMTSLMFEPAKTKNPTGKITYILSREDRMRLLDEIDRLFGEDLKKFRADVENKTDDYNAILFSVDAIRNNLLPETYEEAAKMAR